MSQPDKSPDKVDGLPTLPGFPRPDEPELEDLTTEWDQEDQEIEGRKPDLDEVDS